MKLDPARVAALIAETSAEDILPRFRNLSAADIREKNPNDRVTVADEAAERRLSAGLAALLPGCKVVGEEGAEGDPARLATLSGSDPVWIIDPVDGTQNFIEGDDRFTVVVALCLGGETIAGWIHRPVTGRTACAEAGGGAWLDGQRMQLHPPPSSATEMIGAMGWGLAKRLKDPLHRIYGAFEAVKAHVVHYRCTGLEYMDLAAGTLHYAAYRKLKPWDHAAGVLLHREAGGHSGYVSDGRAYRPVMPHQDLFLVAPDRAAWEALRRVFNDHGEPP